VVIGEETYDSIPLATVIEVPSETPERVVVPDQGGLGKATSQETPWARQAAQGYLVKGKSLVTEGGHGQVKGTPRLPEVTSTITTSSGEGDTRENRKRELDSLAQERRDPKGAAEQQQSERAQKRQKEDLKDANQWRTVATEEVDNPEQTDSDTERKLRGLEFLPKD
jgi:hypothetical protein